MIKVRIIFTNICEIFLMFVVHISFKNIFFLKCMFNQLYIKEKSLSSCLMYVILIWGQNPER